MFQAFKKDNGSLGSVAPSGASGGFSFASGFFQQAMDKLPTNVMIADKDELIVRYANPATINTLRTLEGILPIKAEELVGSCIDIFHKKPEFQRHLLANRGNLPHSAEIALGEEILNLNLDALNDENGNFSAIIVNWSVVTSEKKKESEINRVMQVLDQIPVNVLTCDPQTLVIEYANKTSLNTLKTIEHLIPCKANEIVGQCIDIFHKNPSHQRNILGSASNLPFNSNINLGEHTLKLEVNPVSDLDGNYMQAVLCWEVVTEQVAVANKVNDAAGSVASATNQLSASAATLSESAQSSRELATGVASNAEQASGNVNSVATAAEELAASTTEIGRQVEQASKISLEAKEEAESASATVASLDEAGQKIGDVVNMINDIASQTNLLALNATIEAARAGEAGRGFAVVASEVKALAQQTGEATGDITLQIETMQSATKDVVVAIDGITKTIVDINDTSSNIAAAVEEQGSATEEIARHSQQVASATKQMAEDAKTMGEAAQNASHGVDEITGAVNELSQQAEGMNSDISDFLRNLGIDK